MKVNFKYDKEKDVWCLLNYGRSSMNSKTITKVYQKIIDKFGENISPDAISDFISDYLKESNLNIEKFILEYQMGWDNISEKFKTKAEEIFNVKLDSDITAYLSINNRSPYNIPENYFFVSVPAYMRKTVMHELWHFYTWYKFGIVWEEKLGKQKYNDLKEALTVLLNIEFKDFLNEVEDVGYPQHKELRNKILEIWNEDKNIEKLWEKIIFSEYGYSGPKPI